MKNSKITRKITQGMYVLTVKGGGCVVDAVARVGSRDDAPLISVAVAKANHSHQLLAENEKFALSVIGEQTDPEVIQVFGFNCSKDCGKLAKIETIEVEDVPVAKATLGYMILEKIDAIDMGTHTLYIGKLIEGDIFSDDEPMSYVYYQEHKDDLTRITTKKDQTAWVCTACGYIYYGETVPDDYKCPLCGLGKEYFKKKD